MLDIIKYSKWNYVSPSLELKFRFNGGHTVNVFNRQGKNIDCFSVGNFCDNSASETEAKQGISNYINYLINEVA